MDNYQIDELKNYISNSKLVTINDSLKLRLSKELLEKYKQGLYNDKISLIIEGINEIKKLSLKYPGNANPVFYLYVVPNENFRTLLRVPKLRTKESSGKPVMPYDLDSFNRAYGISSNILERKENNSIMSKINNLHELAHLISSMFFIKDRYISEGFSEALPLYTMNYEINFDMHVKCLAELSEEQILSANQLIELCNKNAFDTTPIIPNMSVSFELPYISSYLFIRGCIKTIKNNYNIDKIEATQKLLEIIRASSSTNQWLVYDIANAINIPNDELLNSKSLQLSVINDIKKLNSNF